MLPDTTGHMFAPACLNDCSGIRSSVVQLELSADNMRFITNNSPGKIFGESVDLSHCHVHSDLARCLLQLG
jgi:hypothetical protein